MSIRQNTPCQFFFDSQMSLCRGPEEHVIKDIPYPIFLLIVEYLYNDVVANLSDMSGETKQLLGKGTTVFILQFDK